MKRFLFLLPFFLLLCSCWDYTELNMQNYVLGFSVDYTDGQYDVCIETVKITGEPISLSASKGVIVESKGLTLFDAVRDAIMLAGKKLYWGHTEIVVISEDVARNHLHAVTDIISRSQDIYSNINLAVAKDCAAKDILYSKTPRDVMASVHLSNIFENEEPSRRFKRCELWQLQRDFPYTLIPAIHLDNFPVVEGSAVICNNALVGYLNGSETQIFSLLEENNPGGYLPYLTVDGATIALEILQTTTRANRVDITVSLASANKPLKMEKIEQAAKELFTEQINALIAKPFGNPLTFNQYDVHIFLNSTGLIKG